MSGVIGAGRWGGDEGAGDGGAGAGEESEALGEAFGGAKGDGLGGEDDGEAEERSFHRLEVEALGQVGGVADDGAPGVGGGDGDAAGV